MINFPDWTLWLLVIIPVIWVVTRRNQSFTYKKNPSDSSGGDSSRSSSDSSGGKLSWLSSLSSWLKNEPWTTSFWKQGWFALVLSVLSIIVIAAAAMNQDWLFANWYYAAALGLATYGWWTNRKKYPWTAIVFYVLVGGFIVFKIVGKLLNDLVGADANGNNIIEGIFAKGLGQMQAFFIAIRDSDLPLYQEPRVWVLVGIGSVLIFLATTFGGPMKTATADTGAKSPAKKAGGSVIGSLMSALLMLLLMGGLAVAVLYGVKNIDLSSASWGDQGQTATLGTQTEQMERLAVRFCEEQDMASYEGRPILGLDVGAGLHTLGRWAGLTAPQETVQIQTPGRYPIGLCPDMATGGVIYKDVWVTPDAGSSLVDVKVDPGWQKNYRPARGLQVVFGQPTSYIVSQWPEDVLGYVVPRSDQQVAGWYRIVISAERMAEYKLGGLLIQVTTPM